MPDCIENEKITLPPAPFVLSKEELEIAHNRVMSITIPYGIDWKQKKLFRRNGFSQIKSVEWKHALTCGIIKYCIKDLIGDQQRSTLFELCDIIALVTSDTLSLNELDMIELGIHRVLSLLERDFPVSLHVVFHLLHHVPQYLRRLGPVHGYHMFPMERFNSWIKQTVTSRRYPESIVLESYRLFEFTFFLQISKKLPEEACKQIAFISNDENEVHTLDNCGILDADEVKALDSLYKITDPEYVSLNYVYENEKKKARKDHRLRKFPPLSQWLPESDLEMHLTSFHLDLRSGPSNQAAILRVYWHRNQAGRLVKYTTMKQSMYSSCVALKSGNQFNENRITFGKITKICRHSFNQKMWLHLSTGLVTHNMTKRLDRLDCTL